MVQPFKISPFTNPSGTVVWRVSGKDSAGRRIRENYADRAEAFAICNQKNAAALMGEGTVVMRVAQTRLSHADVAVAEGWVARIDGRWPLGAVLEAGVAALEKAAPVVEAVRPLLEEWLAIVKPEVDVIWYRQLKASNGQVLVGLGEPSTMEFTRERFRGWLDGQKHLAPQSKANVRNCVHRFGAWLVERGKIPADANPGAGIRIRRRRTPTAQAVMPLVFWAAQAEALLRAVEAADCRRLKGWVVLCLLCGLRPDSEAARLQWSEINLESGELTVMGRKRGARPRVVKLQALAVEWLRSVRADGEEMPGQYWRHLRVRAVKRANAWLAEHRPGVPAIEWDNDIQRHTYISMRAAQGVPMHLLAEECGTGVTVIYAHYRNPRPAAEVATFWGIRRG